ncbi:MULTISPECIES: hypothetical protein [Clostridium]|jgi:hypothetical protein|uniref:Lipoprotein n=1 Tax=Clostridium lapidicellarium TaxID=3240931 RepID=A0ABV4DXV8_9CLOT
MYKKVLCLFVISLFVLSFAGCGDSGEKNSSKTASPTKTVQKSKPKKADLQSLVAQNFKDGKIVKSDNELTIQFTGNNVSPNMMVTGGIPDCMKGLNAVYKNSDFKKFSLIHISIMGTFTDKYGKQSRDRAITFTFDQSELQKVENFMALTSEQFIALEGQNRTWINVAVRPELSQDKINLLQPPESEDVEGEQ